MKNRIKLFVIAVNLITALFYAMTALYIVSEIIDRVKDNF